MSVTGKFHLHKYSFALSLFCLLFLADSYADTAVQHHLHLGLGIGGQHLPHYRGSKETHTKVLPVPLVEYKGRILKADRDGTRAEFILSERIELNVSADLALNDGAEDNPVREGMPELESEFQFGPSINIDLTGDGFSRGWLLRLPVRPAMTVGDEVDFIGYTFNPMFTYIKPNLFDKWRVSMDLGLLYASDDYHQHYYSVAPKYVTATRPAYEAKGGFSGTFSEISIASRKGNFIYGFSLRYDNLREAVFYKSPLVETENYWSVSFGIGWLLKRWDWQESL